MNRHLKKVLSITFVFILAFVLIACNNGASSADKEAVEAAKLDVTMGKIIGTNASKDEIKEDLVLPLKSGDVVVSWSSDNKDVITDAGKVVRPEEEDIVVTLTAAFKLNDAEGTKTFVLTVIATGGTTPGEAKVVEFDFTTTDLGYSYSSNNNSAKTIQNTVNNTNVNVVVTRVAANNNHGTFKDPFLVFSGSTKEGNSPATIEIDLGTTVNKLTFEAVFWSTFDVEEVTKADVFVFRNNEWINVLNLKEALAGTTEYKPVEVNDLNTTKVKITVEGNAPGGTGNNGARILIDNMVFFGEGGTPTNPIDPVDPVDPVDPTDFDFHETFDTASLTASYADGDFTGVGGIVWTYTHSRDEGDFAIDGKGIMLRRALDSYLEVTLPDGVGAFSFEYRKAFTGTNERELEIIVNGTQVVTSDPFGSDSGEQATVYTLTHNINTAGPVTIRIKNVGDGDFNRQIIIDNIKWSNFS